MSYVLYVCCSCFWRNINEMRIRNQHWARRPILRAKIEHIHDECLQTNKKIWCKHKKMCTNVERSSKWEFPIGGLDGVNSIHIIHDLCKRTHHTYMHTHINKFHLSWFCSFIYIWIVARCDITTKHATSIITQWIKIAFLLPDSVM